MSRSRERYLLIARVVSLVASTAISLASGTNYVYSAYAPQLSERLGLTATESNLIGTFGNLGTYLSGIPSGMLVDNKGPRPSILIGAACLFIGYYPIHLAMLYGRGSTSVPVLCFFSTLTGVGSCCSFGGALKMAALNWPHHRGTATAMPLAAYGLSAFFFSFLSSWLFPGNTADFLLVLAVATSGLIFVAFFFCRVVPVPGSYGAVPTDDPDTNRLHRAKSGRLGRLSDEEIGTSTAGNSGDVAAKSADPAPSPDPNPEETTSLFSKSSSSDDEEEDLREAESRDGVDGNAVRDGCSDVPGHRHNIDIRGWTLLRSTDFWLLFTTLGAFTGVGLMTINNIGHNAQALWASFDPSKSPEFVQKNQGLHVSILSICSFTGRMLSGTLTLLHPRVNSLTIVISFDLGVSSDILVKRYQTQRLWLIVISAAFFFIGQIASLTTKDPYFLWTVSTFNGLAYGILFGVFPTIVSEAFGVHGLSTNWGTMTLAAIVAGNILNLFYGKVYDDHSSNGECKLGLECYKNAYYISMGVVLLGFCVTSAAILRNRRIWREEYVKA